MLITWICKKCGTHMAKLVAKEDDHHVAALTAQAEDDIIETDREGNLIVHVWCEDCFEAISSEEDRDFYFLRSPQIH